MLDFFSNMIKSEISNYISQNENNLEEIRIRVNKKIILKFMKNEEVIDYVVSSQEILEILQKICENSIYTYQNEIAEGYVTVKGGHRVRYSWFMCC